MSRATHKSERHARGDPTSALTPWARETPRSDDALSELDAILEGPRLTVAEATTQLEGLIARARRADPHPGFEIEWTPGVEHGDDAGDYRTSSASETRDTGTLRVRFRVEPVGGIGWPITALALLRGCVLVAGLSGDPRWLCGALLGGLVALALHAREDLEVLVASGVWRVTRGVLRKETLELDPASCLRSVRVHDTVGLVAVAPARRVLLGSVSPREAQITELPAIFEAFRSLQRAHGTRSE